MTFTRIESAQTGRADDLVPAHLLVATKAVLADREAELLALKGPCSNRHCRLHYAHSGPCDVRKACPGCDAKPGEKHDAGCHGGDR